MPKTKKRTKKQVQAMPLGDSELARFAAIVGIRKWQDTDEGIDELDDADFWADAWLAGATRRIKKIKFRQMIRLLKAADDNMPLYASLVIPTEDGSAKRIYKNIETFDKDDYHQIAAYEADRVNHDLNLCKGYGKRYLKEYGEQLKFPFAYDIRL